MTRKRNRTASELSSIGLVPLMTTEEVSELLRVDPSTLCRWRTLGVGPRVTWLSSRIPRYQRAHVMDWLQGSAA